MTAEALLPYTVWEFAAIVGGLVMAGIMYGPAYHFLRLYRAGMKAAAGGGANGPVWHAAGCAASTALGTMMIITIVVVVAAALDSDPYDGSSGVGILFVMSTIMCFATTWCALWVEFYTPRGRALATGIVGLMSVASYASGLLIVFGLMPVIDWCTVFTCVPGGDLTK